MLQNHQPVNNLMIMVRDKTKEILCSYIKGDSISRTANTLGLARKTVSNTYKLAEKTSYVIKKIWFPESLGESERELYSDSELSDLRNHFQDVYKDNPLIDKSQEEKKEYFRKCLDRMSNEEINAVLFPREDKENNDEELMQIAEHLEGPGVTLSDCYTWAKEKKMRISGYSESHFQRLFRDYRKKYGISDRVKFKPGDVMEIRWYRLNYNKNDNLSLYPMPASKYLSEKNTYDKDDRSGKWLLVTYLPFSRRVSMNVFYKRHLDNMVEAIEREIVEVGAPRRLVSDLLKRDLVESTRKWPIFSQILNTYDISYTKDDSLCVFEEMEADIIDRIRECLSKSSWSSNINNKILSIVTTQNNKAVYIEEEKKCLRPYDPISFDKNQKKIGLYSVQGDSHVLYGRKRYSCPYEYVGKQVLLCRTIEKISLFDNDTGALLAEHMIIPKENTRVYSTYDEHMPKSDEERRRVGMDTRDTLFFEIESEDIRWLLNMFLDSFSSEEMGYETVNSLLRIEHKYNRRSLKEFSREERKNWNEWIDKGYDLELCKSQLRDDLLVFKRRKSTKEEHNKSRDFFFAFKNKVPDFGSENDVVEEKTEVEPIKVLGEEEVEDMDFGDISQ